MLAEETLIPLEPNAFRALTASKKFNETSNKLLDLAYSEDGNGLLVSAEDVILVYDLHDGSKSKPVECKKYGVDRLEYLTSETCVHSDTKTGNVVRLLNITKKSYIKYFHGHTEKIIAIRSNPKSRERFISSSFDGSIRMFDSRTFDYYGFIHTAHPALIAFDPEGLLFATATKSETIRLFDVRSFDLGPFQVFRLQKNDNDEWSNIEFSSCGKFILVSTKGEVIKWVDAFTGVVVHEFKGHKNPNKIDLRATVSSGSGYVMVGSADRNIYVYSTENGSLVCKLPTPYVEPSHVVSFNPKQFLLTSLGRDVILWAPSEEYNNEH
ncbi:hypothetical protein CRE_16557 [Caenorhabditis remanei]|uniref:Anaphase-promoting complex subunit 4 WD40 domain-containing protein n=1 Tax=Caenorhabditis remanei TaxID=31234 RepID=E3NTF4_CAERE|nr:hypothetical protein CRE_16557 [Caenorhabditis remanei]